MADGLRTFQLRLISGVSPKCVDGFEVIPLSSPRRQICRWYRHFLKYPERRWGVSQTVV
jgi:hypothetical protein